jgi:hypothetical protein
MKAYDDIGCAKVDVSRWERQSIPEAVFCPGKTVPHIVKIVKSMMKRAGPVLLTRVTFEQQRALKKTFPKAKVYVEARMIVIQTVMTQSHRSPIAVITAGTADIPVAEEACITIEAIGGTVERLFDVGVAGVHRLFHNKHILDQAPCVIVCAGMEGALASVVGGLVGVPVIAVPTSVGYGVSLQGIAPLLTMLNSCAPNVSVVNIDNGFGAGVIAHLITKTRD